MCNGTYAWSMKSRGKSLKSFSGMILLDICCDFMLVNRTSCAGIQDAKELPNKLKIYLSKEAIQHFFSTTDCWI